MNRWRWYLSVAVVVGLSLAWPTLASMSSVAGLFQAGQYDQARQALQEGGEGSRPGEEVLWRSRLATDPAEALRQLESGLEADISRDDVRVRLALEIAEIHAGRGNHREALDALTPLLSGNDSRLPGAVYMRAALSLRARGRLQQAREMLASIRPGDPEFVLARYYLGDIGLEQKDAALALRYFEAAATASEKASEEAGANHLGTSRLGAGLWRAHMLRGQEQEALDLVAKLTAEDPGGLALLEIRRLIQAEADERDARDVVTPPEKFVTPITDLAIGFSLQLGAFSDRSLALDFLKRFRGELPDLRIDEVRDQRGQFLYKVRSGNYDNPAVAHSEAQQLQDRLGIDIMVADLSAGSQQSGR